MTEPLFESHEHPPVEELAALAASAHEERAHDDVVRHLAACRRCMGTYAEFVATQLRASAATALQTAPSDLVELGLSVPATTMARSHGSTRPRYRFRFAPAWGLLGAATLAGLLVLWWPFGRVPAPLRQAVGEQMQEDSQGGLLYGADLLPRPRETRGGTDAGPFDPAALEQLVQRYNEGHPSADVAYWLVGGYLATNQQRNADPYLRESLERFPKDMRLHNLAAILAYKRNDPKAAEARLREALQLDRSSLLLVNLAILRRQQGDEAEAQRLLREVQRVASGSGIGAFARNLATADAP